MVVSKSLQEQNVPNQSKKKGCKTMKKALSVLLALIMCLTLCACGKAGDYKDAIALMNEKRYEEAITAFEALGDYQDAPQKLIEAKELEKQAKLEDIYQNAISSIKSGDYQTAIKFFMELSDYKDSQDLLSKCCFDYAKELFENSDYANAREQFMKAKQSEEVNQYLRLSAWGMVRDYLDKEGPIKEKDSQYDVEESTQVESICEIDKQGKSVIVNANQELKISE